MKNKKLGTEWVEPGKGAKVAEITDAIRATFGMSIDGANLVKAWERLIDLGLSHPTNLRLTGNPIADYDLQRISFCG